MGEIILHVKNLNVDKKTSSGAETLISDGCFDISSGEVVRLSGMNGKGKTAIVKIIMGDSDFKGLNGEIRFCNGENLLLKRDIQDFRSQVIYIEQTDVFACETVFDELFISLETCKTSLSFKEITGKVEELLITNDFVKFRKENPRKLSGGQKRKLSYLVGMIRAQYCKLLIIDEPFGSLDKIQKLTIIGSLKKLVEQNKDLGILIIHHGSDIDFLITKTLEIQGCRIECNG